MKISRLTMGIGAAVLFAVACAAQAGSLSPALAHLAANYARSPNSVQSFVTHPGARPSVFDPRVDATGAVQVYIHYRAGQRPANAALYVLGATQIRAALGVVQAWVPIAHLNQLAALGGVTRVGLPAYAIVRGASPQPQADSCTAVTSGLQIDKEGIAAQNVQPVLDQGITGSGVKVGIISDGVDCKAKSQAAGYLPNNIYVDPGTGLQGSGDEGTAMLEEVHAVAPGATLGFCGPGTSVDFVTCYNDFATWGADIISDDLGFPSSFFFNDPKGDAFISGIQQFAQTNPDISLVTAAGNDRQDYYQADYAPSAASSPIGLTPNGGRTYKSVMDFGGDAYQTVSVLNVPAGFEAYFLLTWDDPLNGPYDDLDLYLLDSSNTILDSSTLDQTGGANPPEEAVDYTNSSGGAQTLKLVVMCYVCNKTPNLLVKLTGTLDGAGSFASRTDGGVYGQAALAEEISTAAAHVNNTQGTSATVENFSDTGPYTGGDWQNGTTTVPKPDITGIDGVTVSGAGGFGSPFYGTSAASPNVASVIALLRSAFPSSTNTAAQWKQLIEANANTQRLTGSPPASQAGAGLVDAQAALAGVDGTLAPAIAVPAGSPVDVDPNTDVSFQADCNYTGSQTLNYQWSFGGDSGIPNSTQLMPDPVQYANGGLYTVKFTCSDQYQSKTAQKAVTVEAAATAMDQSLTTAYETPTTGQFTGTGIGGEQVKYEVVQGPAHGTLNAYGSASFAYTPDNGYSGTDSFTFDIDNGVMKSNTATVTVSVGAKPAPPPSGGGGGGGAFGLGGLAALFGLAGLLALRRRR
ncbi:MAG: Ig-like domain-containing protein [Gammaproteobacteria bacterium]